MEIDKKIDPTMMVEWKKNERKTNERFIEKIRCCFQESIWREGRERYFLKIELQTEGKKEWMIASKKEKGKEKRNDQINKMASRKGRVKDKRIE